MDDHCKTSNIEKRKDLLMFLSCVLFWCTLKNIMGIFVSICEYVFTLSHDSFAQIAVIIEILSGERQLFLIICNCLSLTSNKSCGRRDMVKTPF